MTKDSRIENGARHVVEPKDKNTCGGIKMSPSYNNDNAGQAQEERREREANKA